MGCARRAVVDALAAIHAADTPSHRPDKAIPHRAQAIVAGQTLCFSVANFDALSSNTLKVLLAGRHRLLRHTVYRLQAIFAARYDHLLNTRFIVVDL